VRCESKTNFANENWPFAVAGVTGTNLPVATCGSRGSSLARLQSHPDPLSLDSNHHFIYEAMVIMDACQGMVYPRLPMFRRSTPCLGEMRSLVDLVAVSLVRGGVPNDNVATAIYQTSTEIAVYYTKPQIREKDFVHASQFARLIRQRAEKSTPLQEFRASYFELILRNCQSSVVAIHDTIKSLTTGKMSVFGSWTHVLLGAQFSKTGMNISGQPYYSV
jgi:hypothetical protein